MNLKQFQVSLQLYALEAVSHIEARARDILVTQGKTLAGKEGEAVEFVMERYRVLTLDVAVLNATDLDDEAVRALATTYVHQAFDFAGGMLNQLSHSAPVTDAVDVPAATVGQ